MDVFVLGGTGTIGTAIIRELGLRSHSVTALSRSTTSDKKLGVLGVRPFRGDLAKPDAWAKLAASHDAIIQVAATFGDDMGEVDERVIKAIIEATGPAKQPIRMLYTGGCWLYGETGDEVATEDTPFAPLPAFAWMVDHGERLLKVPGLSTAIIHPAMVYHEEGGAFERFLSAARDDCRIEIWGDRDTRWPIIERSDLARAYCDLLMLPHLVGHFNAVAQEGVRVEDIAKSIAQAHGGPLEMNVLNTDELVKRHGAWAKGPTLDQQMSSRKLRQTTGWAPAIRDYRSSALVTK